MRHRYGPLTFLALTATASIGYCQPVITQQPAGQSVSLGAQVTLQVTVSGAAPFSYQWRLNGQYVVNATNRTLILTNVEVMDAGDYVVIIANASGSVTSQVAHLEVDPMFTKITTGSLVTHAGTAQGGAWGDYDNDGFIDLFVTSAYNSANNTPQKCILYHNTRDGTFTVVTNSVLSIEARDWRGAAWADYDNDGALDLMVVSTSDTGFPSQNELFHNNGDGTFTKMADNNVGGIVSLAAGGSEGPIWGDYDNDGFLDLFIARYGPDWLIHNNGDGTFSNIANVLPADSLDSYSAVWFDYDNDGFPDLFVANNISHLAATNSLFHNNRDGTFMKIVENGIGTDKEGWITCGAVDYDNDGYLDLFVSNPAGGSALYHNNQDGSFTRMTSNTVGRLAADGTGFFTFAWGDYDNDGFIDVFVTVPGNPGKNELYHNNGDGSFTQVLSGSLVNDASTAPSIGCAWGDYDNDGFLDLFVARGGDAETAANLLYRNNGNSNAWIKIKLVGTVSNRSAVGAKVRVRATIHGREVRQLREVSSGSGFNPTLLDPHFGLGDATNIDELRIEWPSGIVQTMSNVPPRQSLAIYEHQDLASSAVFHTEASRLDDGMVQLSVVVDGGAAYEGLHLLFEGSTNLVNWVRLGSRINDAGGQVVFADPAARLLNQRFYRVSAP